MKNICLLIISTVIILLSSCSSSKNITYFQDLSPEYSEIKGVNYQELTTFRVDDELSITVSASDPQAAAVYNLFVPSSHTGVNLATSEVPMGYIVDHEGFINFPVLGKIKVEGLTRTQLTTLLEEKLKTSIKNPIVTVKHLSFRIGMLGEVNAPGTYYFGSNQRMSILDAIAQARDLTLYGNRKNILLIREGENGEKKMIRLDLTKSDIFSSPNFYLQQNDIVYVEPNQVKQNDSNMGNQKQYNMSVITSIIGTVISTASIMIALFK